VDSRNGYSTSLPALASYFSSHSNFRAIAVLDLDSAATLLGGLDLILVVVQL
jgi:hypothetical protein